MNINFELYKVFYHVSKHLSFSAASADLFISQSAVSQAIRQLEDKLSVRLFSRNTKHVRLTHEGELLFKHIEQAYCLIKTGERSIAEMHGLALGEIRIGASDTICKYYLLPYLQTFIQAYPRVKVNIINRPSPHCIDLLQKGQVDISIVNLPHEQPPAELAAIRLMAIHDVFIAGSAYLHLKNQTISLHELSAFPLLTLEKHTTTRRYLEHLFLQHGLSLSPEVELGSLDLLVEMAKINLGIAFVVKEFLPQPLDDAFFILHTKEAIPPHYLGILTHEKLPLSTAAQKFVNLLKVHG